MEPIDTIKQIQFLLGVTPDGQFGPKSSAALESLVLSASAPPQPLPLPDSQSPANPVDARSEANIKTLLPQVQVLARALVRSAAEHGITIVVTSGSRTYAEQDALYEQGRSTAGEIVTKARGGFSNHNFSIAFDVTVFKEGKPVWESPAYNVVGMLGKQLGLDWGGDWHSIEDDPHFELHPAWAKGESEASMLAELRKRHDSGQGVFA